MPVGMADFGFKTLGADQRGQQRRLVHAVGAAKRERRIRIKTPVLIVGQHDLLADKRQRRFGGLEDSGGFGDRPARAIEAVPGFGDHPQEIRRILWRLRSGQPRATGHQRDQDRQGDGRRDQRPARQPLSKRLQHHVLPAQGLMSNFLAGDYADIAANCQMAFGRSGPRITGAPGGRVSRSAGPAFEQVGQRLQPPRVRARRLPRGRVQCGGQCGGF